MLQTVQFECSRQTLKSIYIIQFLGCVNSTFPLIDLWGNKKWLPSMKVKKMEKFQNEMGCKWSCLNVPGIEIYLCHLILELDESPFPIIHSLG